MTPQPLVWTAPAELGRRARARIGQQLHQARIVAVRHELLPEGRGLTTTVRLDGVFAAGNPWRAASEVELIEEGD